MKTSSFSYLAFACLAISACAAPNVTDDDNAVDDSEGELRAACEIGVSCSASMKLLGAASGAQTRQRTDVSLTSTWFPPVPHIVRQATSVPMKRTKDVAFPLDAFDVDDFVLFEVLDGTTGARIDAAFAGYSSGTTVKLEGDAVRRLGGESFHFDANAVDLASLLPKNRVFRIRATAFDVGGAAYVKDLVARPKLASPPALQTFVLAGNPQGTTNFHVDDDIVVRVNGTEAHHSTSGSAYYGPLAFQANVGDVLSIALYDTYGGCLDSGDIWLSGPGIAPTRVVWAIPQRCGTAASATTPFHTIDIAIGAAGPAAPAPVATDRTQSVLKANNTPIGRDITAALEKWVSISEGGNVGSSFHFWHMLVYGYEFGPMTSAMFDGELAHFTIQPQTAVNRQFVDALVASWQPKIDTLRAKTNADHASGLISTPARDEKLKILNSLQTVVDDAMKPLSATLARYPEVARVKLDLR